MRRKKEVAPDVGAAQQALDRDRQQRQDAAAVEIQRICDKYRVVLVPVVHLVGTSQIPEVKIAAN